MESTNNRSVCISIDISRQTSNPCCGGGGEGWWEMLWSVRLHCLCAQSGYASLFISVNERSAPRGSDGGRWRLEWGMRGGGDEWGEVPVSGLLISTTLGGFVGEFT